MLRARPAFQNGHLQGARPDIVATSSMIALASGQLYGQHRLCKNGAATRCHNMFGPCVAALTLGLAPLVYPFARYWQHFPLPVRCSRPWDPQQV